MSLYQDLDGEEEDNNDEEVNDEVFKSCSKVLLVEEDAAADCSCSSSVLTAGRNDGVPLQHYNNNSNNDNQYHNATATSTQLPLSQSLPIQPAYSLLNVAIDYVMTPPTPFEWLEFEKSSRSTMNTTTSTVTRVPVIRIFGPLLKHTNSTVPEESQNHHHTNHNTSNNRRKSTKRNCIPRQSGCVHIHNVFPYFLARPQWSMLSLPSQTNRYNSNNNKEDEDNNNNNTTKEALDLFRFTAAVHIDWDNYDSIESSLYLLKYYLELSCIDVYMANRTSNPTPHPKPQQRPNSSTNLDPLNREQPSKSTPDFIRNITICSGRAFYSYDPNPPSYFLKIEYYNPYDRHMIRALLQNSSSTTTTTTTTTTSNIASDNHNDHMNNPKQLKFHCFEAHIPYTMQFFKDYNLAGLKYIHLDNGTTNNTGNNDQHYHHYNGNEIKLLFRTPLPSTATPQPKQQRPSLTDNNDGTSTMDRTFYILQDNTPKNLLWDSFLHQQKDEEQPIMDDDDDDEELKLLKSYKPPNKVTDCENIVEFDIDASAILNIYQVLTPEDITATQKLDETRNVYWRAVPSLREIWEEEKARMDILLQDYPEDNFLRNQDINLKKTSEITAARKRGRDDDATINLAQTVLSDERKVNSSQRISGTKEAIKGICSLFSVGADGESSSEVLHDSQTKLFDLYRRAMIDILDRHQQTVEMEERYWRNLHAPTSLSISSPDDEGGHPSMTDLSGEQNPFLHDLGALHGQFASPQERLFTPLTQPRFSSDSFTASSSTTTRGKQTSQHGLLSEFTPPTPEQLSAGRRQKLLASFQQKRSTGLSLSRLTPQITTKPLSENTLRRTQTQIADEIKLEAALVWEESEEEDNDDYEENQDTEESLERELLTLEVEAAENSTVSRLKSDSPFNHGVILELNRTLPSNLTCVLNKSTATLCLGYSGEFDKLKSYVSEQCGHSLLSPETVWWEPAFEPPCPKLVRCQWVSKKREQVQQEKVCQAIGVADRAHHSDRGGIKSSAPLSMKSKVNELKLQIPLTVMSVEIHVQCRLAKTGSMGVREVAMTPNSDRDAVYAIVYVLSKDHGCGEIIEVTQKGCLYLPVAVESCKSIKPTLTSEDVLIEAVQSERGLFHRFASIVQMRDPDILTSWDTHGSGIGYLIKRGVALGNVTARDRKEPNCPAVDMVRLLGRTPKAAEETADVAVNDTLTQAISSVEQVDKIKWKGSGLGSEWDDLKGSGVAASSIVGRLVWCGWKITSEEVKHPLASSQNAMVSTVLRKRIPCIDGVTLNRWYGAEDGHQRFRVIQYRLDQAEATLLILDALDIIGRTGETARLSGIEFSQSLPGIRGSQYKVEGVLLRALQSVASDERGQKKGRNKSHLSGPSSSLSGHSDSQNPSPWKLRRNFTQHLAGRKNRDVLGTYSNPKENESPYSSSRGGLENRGFFFFSLGKEEKDQLEPLRVQALTLEPSSGFYKDPVVVCDFTALYPSLVIAYNLCYSTCAGQIDYTSLRQETVGRGMTTGRVGPFRYPEQLTATILKQHVKSLSKSKNGIKRIADDRAYVAPNGAIFVGESVLRGVLPQVLSEILMTRAMIKRAAKIYKARGVELSVLRQLEARQLALKYVANVTYGYTSATFSGRSAMPVLADAIVECARRTLTNAIRLAEKWGKEQGGKWEGAEVIYGDTDSIFVKLPGRTVEEAFIFGKEFCEEVTFSNPPPVELKLEKVYKGTLLQTKKRYCGMKFDAPHQEPELESKGIETIRKDQCHLTQKILSQALVTVFKQGKEALKDLLERQWANIYAGKLPVSDFILTGRVRDKYRKGAEKSPPAAAALVRRLAQSDPGLVIRDKERVSYVVVASPGRSIRLSDCVVTPLELLEQWDSYRINVAYYITKHLNAALHRCFSLPPYSIDVHKWYEASPKPRKRIQYWPASSAGATSMITSYFGSDVCTLCNRKCKMVGNSRLVVICKSCRKNKQWTTLYTLERCGQAQRRAHQLAKICKTCTGCPETGDSFAVEVVTRLGKMARTVATPLANCVCTDCPITYERHRAKEELIFTDELCKALDLSW